MSSSLRRQEARASERSDQSGGATKSSKVVFGLQATTQKAASCNKAAAAAANTTATSRETDKTIASSTTKLVFGLNPRTNRLKHDEYAEKRGARQQAAAAIISGDNKETSDSERENSATSGQQQNGQVKQQQTDSRNNLGPKLRASKYGNFYKPQDLVMSSSQQKQQSTGSITNRDNTSDKRRTQSPARTSSRTSSFTRDSSPTRRHRSPSPTKKPLAPASASDKNLTSDRTTTSSKMREESSSEIKQQPPPVTKKQFTIPPPPQISAAASSTGAKGSVVRYAKSRIYDKPAANGGHNKPLNCSSAGNLTSGGHSPLLNSGAIPESILSGFKPPKQVNVSKAREKWEGGEPFAKCKSRQRLAAAQAANRKLVSFSGFAGGWYSSQSVVAAQQLQLQQSMSNSLAGNKNKDAPVKILTRGSVLERVQQFEKTPSTSGGSSSGGSSSGSSSPGSEGSGSSGSLSDLLEDQAGTEAGLALQQPLEPAELRAQSPSSKQAIYKSRVSSIQTSGGQDPLAAITDPKSPPVAAALQQRRRLSLRRRSSLGSNSNNQIPKFYHPNGKPNTYEIELQKKNIVACFDKFPEREALLTGTSARRHFHAIALACGFSEYFKEPLFLYVKHQMTESNLLHNLTGNGAVANGSRQHRQSGLGLAMINANSSRSAAGAAGKPLNESDKRPKSLIKAASIDNSTMEKLQNQTSISCDQFLVCWRNMISSAFDLPARFVHLLTMGQRNYLIPDDFVPLIQSIIDDHPGLKFLRAAPDFHLRYIQTVIARIYFCINQSWTGKISLTELRRSNLLAVLQVLSQEEDINQITDYFSYEHFYVIYCKFWNLDQDHDLLISKEDLAKHNDAAISSRIIERIFMGIVSKQIQQTGKMSFSDFVWFLLAEEDKKHPRSIEYWFRLMDIDGDGYISMYEMEYFYYEQMKRLELMNIEALPFMDTACQILDLVNPKEKNKISLADLKRTKMATIFFDTFINLEKYLEHESREFVSTRDVVQDGVVISDWDRYASEEYESLVTEETSV